MQKFTVTIIALLTLGACADKAEPPDASTAATSYKEAQATADAPPPAIAGQPADTPQSADADAGLEAAIRATSPDYRVDITSGADDTGKARYRAVRADLNDDGQAEVFVYMMGPYFCGTGGCNLLVFSQGMDGYLLLANIPISDPPVIVTDARNEGYADFWRLQSGGGAPAEYVLHRYKGGKYVEESRAPATSTPAGTVVLDEQTDFASGIVLEPAI